MKYPELDNMRPRAARCPWCDTDPNDNRYLFASVKQYKAGTRETRRMLRRGRARVWSLKQEWPGNVRVDNVICAHPCHETRFPPQGENRG